MKILLITLGVSVATIIALWFVGRRVNKEYDTEYEEWHRWHDDISIEDTEIMNLYPVPAVLSMPDFQYRLLTVPVDQIASLFTE